MKTNIAALGLALLALTALPARATDQMMDDPQKMEALRKGTESMDKAIDMMKKAMTQKNEAMAREAREMARKALEEWNRGDPMKGF